MKSLKTRIEGQLEFLDESEYFSMLDKYLEDIKPVEYKGRKKARKQKKKAIIRHPGYELNEIMKTRNLTADKLALACKVEKDVINSLCNQEIELTEDLASKLATHIGQTQEYWIGLQNKFDKLGQR